MTLQKFNSNKKKTFYVITSLKIYKGFDFSIELFSLELFTYPFVYGLDSQTSGLGVQGLFWKDKASGDRMLH